MAFYAARTQLFPAAPKYTEDDYPNQKGKVFIVTGSNTGIGFALAKVLYSKEARVYMATRTKAKALAAIKEIESIPTSTPGELRYLPLNLADLSTIKATAEEFQRQETELHVLWNNAGIGLIPQELTPQGHDLYIATMCIGPHLLTQLLLPQLRRAAANSPKSSVRVVWTGSRLMDADSPPGGLVLAECTNPVPNQTSRSYASSKAGNYFLGAIFAKKLKDDGIVSLTINPGNLRTQTYDRLPKALVWLISPLLYHPKFGAYTGLWAGLSEEVTMEDTGRYGIPWGRWHPKMRQDLLEAVKSKDEGGTGGAGEFWEWCEAETKKWR